MCFMSLHGAIVLGNNLGDAFPYSHAGGLVIGPLVTSCVTCGLQHHIRMDVATSRMTALHHEAYVQHRADTGPEKHARESESRL